ncbi:hypothetical protein NEOLI_004888 [Neolecta irregularis DAH-3]|uniref:Uncharacterized protein n=1 Tax=Neolecta irregularis (strain DAH-3) TaxID=1198029 RepID=A0A1U7LQR8_NEOID|nr:hypothetical protein NEOLI_004888 [Neolecta irregularis DAH-3]|eukprot:OLL24861.1 hypothetical protein NEOLI_004888 [Neolecta irregularis DAH-3]
MLHWYSADIFTDPAYISLTSARAIINLPGGSRSLEINTASLRLINTFLDHLLYTFLVRSKSTGLPSLRAAIAKSLPAKLGTAAMAEAEAELRTYVGEEDTDNGKEGLSDSEIEKVWKAARCKCMIYSTLGSCEESDLPHSREGEIAPPSAIYLTAILEFIGEHALMTVSRTAVAIVEESDVERGLATDEMTSRMYRRWRKSERRQISQSTISRPNRSRTLENLQLDRIKSPSTDGLNRSIIPIATQSEPRVPIALSTPVVRKSHSIEIKQSSVMANSSESSLVPRISSEKRYSLFPNMTPFMSTPQSMSAHEYRTPDLGYADDIEVSDIEKEIGCLAIPFDVPRQPSSEANPLLEASLSRSSSLPEAFQTILSTESKASVSGAFAGPIGHASSKDGKIALFLQPMISIIDRSRHEFSAPVLNAHSEEILGGGENKEIPETPLRERSDEGNTSTSHPGTLSVKSSQQSLRSHPWNHPREKLSSSVSCPTALDFNKEQLTHRRSNSTIDWKPSYSDVEKTFLGGKTGRGMGRRRSQTDPYDLPGRNRLIERTDSAKDFEQLIRSNETWKITLKPGYSECDRGNYIKGTIPCITTPSSWANLPFQSIDGPEHLHAQRASKVSFNSTDDKSAIIILRSTSPSLHLSASDSDEINSLSSKPLSQKYTARDAKIPRSSTMELADFFRLTGPATLPTQNTSNIQSCSIYEGLSPKVRKMKEEKLVDFLNNTAPPSPASCRQSAPGRRKSVVSLFRRKTGQTVAKWDENAKSNSPKSGRAPHLSLDVGTHFNSLNDSLAARTTLLLSGPNCCNSFKNHKGSREHDTYQHRHLDASFRSRSSENIIVEGDESSDYNFQPGMTKHIRSGKQESLAEFLKSTMPARSPLSAKEFSTNARQSQEHEGGD